jgi:hypothetical protein
MILPGTANLGAAPDTGELIQASLPVAPKAIDAYLQSNNPQRRNLVHIGTMPH